MKNPYEGNEIYCKIAYKGIQKGDDIRSKLPKEFKFPYLSNNFFCYITDDVSDKVKKLLNDVRTLSNEDFKTIVNEEVLKNSLFRFRDTEKELEALKKKYKK